MPPMRLEAGRAEVLDLCYRWPHKQARRRRVCAFGRRLTALIGEQAASHRRCVSQDLRRRGEIKTAHAKALTRISHQLFATGFESAEKRQPGLTSKP